MDMQIQPQSGQPPCTRAPDAQRVLETAMEAGHILLENGAEIFRVKETMDRICHHFGVEARDFFVLSNGIFTTGGYGPADQYARVQHIPVKGTQLDKVVAVNQLSRDIEAGLWDDIEAVARRLGEIREMPGKAPWKQILASGVGSAAFCYLFGGRAADCAVALLAGLLLYGFVLRVGVRMSKMVGSICEGALVTLICILCYRLGFGYSMSCIIVGAIIPLVPGVPFTNGIRDIANGDYISGAVRLLDAILVFFCVALGVGMVFTVYHRLTGSVLL